ncbi:MAG: PAS domain S-box protein [Pseudomonadota bacterium]|nr:PAS domain S-box protein [Pseudomonadota bacterium]
MFFTLGGMSNSGQNNNESRLVRATNLVWSDLEDEIIHRSFLEAILASTTDSIFLLTDSGRLAYANEAARSTLKLASGRLPRRKFAELWSAACRETINRALQNVIDSQSASVIEVTDTGTDASSTIFELALSPIPEGDGSTARVCVIGREITDRRRTEDSLARTTRLYDTLSHARRAIVRAQNQDALFMEICRILSEFGDFPLTWIGVIDPDSNTIKPTACGMYQTFLADLAVDLDTSASADLSSPAIVARTGVLHTIQNPSPEELDRVAATWANRHGNLRFGSTGAFPLQVGSRTIGVLAVYAEDASGLDSDTVSLLSSLSEDVSFALDVLFQNQARQRAEQALRERESQLAEAQKLAHLGYWWMDTEGQHIDATDEAKRIFGYPADHPGVSHQQLLERVHPDDKVQHLQYLQEMVKGLDQVEFDYRIILPDETERWVHSVTYAERGADHRTQRVYGICQDITERKLAEQALIESEARWQFALEGADEGVWDWDVQTNSVFYSNRWKDMLGYAPDELVNDLSEWDSRLHPEDRSHAYNTIIAYLRERKTPTYAVEYRLRARDGNYIWILDRGKIVDWTDEGLPKRIIGTHTDITERKNAENALKASEAMRSTILNSTMDAIVALDENNKIILFNSAAEDMFHFKADEIAGRPIWDLIPNKLHAGYRTWVKTLPDSENGSLVRAKPVRVYGRRADGSEFPLEVSMTRTELDGQRIYTNVLRDITDLVSAERELRLSAEVLASSAEAICVTDKDRRIISINPALSKMTGYSAADLVGQPSEILYPPQSQALYREARTSAEQGHWQGEGWCRRKSGDAFPIWLTVSAVTNKRGGPTHYIAMFSDITDRKRDADRINYLANHDPLTGLPNRTMLDGLLEKALLSARRSGSHLAILFLDLDRFKTINDSLGHDVGDRLLMSVGQRLKSCLRQSDTVARQGGDEFIILLPDIRNLDRVVSIAEHLLEVIGQPYEVRGLQLNITPSIGVALYPRDGRDGPTLIKNADTAMYAAKERGRANIRFFSRDMAERAKERLAMENRLRKALDNGEFTLHYQPQIDALSGRILGVEALLRWVTPELGIIHPEQFIPVAEESGLIVPLGQWVIEEACRQNNAWRQTGLPHVPVAVNLSALQFQHGDLRNIVLRALRQSTLEGTALELELTEHVLLQDLDSTLRTLRELKDAGIAIAVDDFGTGYSSLGYLKRFPIDKLKIDREFVRDITIDPNDAAITSAIIGLGRSLNIHVVAEGVENAYQFKMLSDWGCDSIQGFFFARPTSAEQLLTSVLEQFGAKRKKEG